MEDDHIGEIVSRHFERAGRRVPGVDLAIALVGEDQETVAAGERAEPRQIGAIRHRALRIGRRGEIEGDRARQQRFAERVEIGQEAGPRRGGQIDRLAIGGGRAGRIGGIERIGNQDRGAAGARRDMTFGGEGGEKQSFARAVEHQDFRLGIDRPGQAKAPAEPAGGGAAERFGSLVGRIAAEIGQMGGEHRSDEERDRMLRLADGEIDRRLARLGIAQKLGQPHERRARVGDSTDGRRGRRSRVRQGPCTSTDQRHRAVR